MEVFALLMVVAWACVQTAHGGCCWPERMAAIEYVPEEPYPRKFVIDFKKNMYRLKPIGSYSVDYVIHDQDNWKYYKMFLSGKCTVKSGVKPVYFQCMQRQDVELGPNNMAGGTRVKIYETNTNDILSVVKMVDARECLPVVTIESKHKERTIVYTNVDKDVYDTTEVTVNHLAHCLNDEDTIIG